LKPVGEDTKALSRRSSFRITPRSLTILLCQPDGGSSATAMARRGSRTNREPKWTA
jgi:hypothetical protein